MKGHQDALEARLEGIGGSEPISSNVIVTPLGMAAVEMDDGSAQRVSAALRAIYAGLNHAAFGYAILHAMAHRFNDSAGAVNTADLAE